MHGTVWVNVFGRNPIWWVPKIVLLERSITYVYDSDSLGLFSLYSFYPSHRVFVCVFVYVYVCTFACI